MKKLRCLLCAIAAALLAIPFSACGKNGDDVVHVYMPDGAPAIALAGLMNGGYDGADFTVVPATDIGARVSTGVADMAIMPVNAAAALYNKGVDIVMLTLNTHGNLFIVGSDPDIDIAGLRGKRMGVIGMGNVPDLTLRMMLEKAGVEYTLSEAAVEGKVALQYKGDGSELLPLLKQGKIDYALLGEPAATTAVTKFENVRDAINVQEEWDALFEYEYPQACLVAKGSLVDNDREFLDAFIAALKASDGWAESHPAEALAAIKAHMETGRESTVATLTSGIIARCNIATVDADDAKNRCDRFFAELANLTIDGKPVMEKAPDLEFYYQKNQSV